MGELLPPKPDFDLEQAPKIEARLRSGFREWLWRNQEAILEEGMMLLRHADKDHGPRVKLFEKLMDKMAADPKAEAVGDGHSARVMNIQINNLDRGRAIEWKPGDERGGL